MFTSITLKRVNLVFLFAIFVVLLPPIKFPFVGPDWLNTNLFARVLIFLTFLCVLGRVFFRGEKWFPKRNFYIDILLLFFIVQSLSVVSAFNGFAYLKAYEKLVFGFMVFIIALGLTKKNESDFFKKVIFVFLLAGVIKLLLEVVLIRAPDLFTSLADLFLKAEVAQSIKANLARRRIYIDLFSETSLPFFLYYFYRPRSKKVQKNISILLAGILGLVAFLSNWRGRVLVYGALLVSSTVLLRKFWLKKFKLLVLAGIILLSSLYILDKGQVVSKGFSVVDRLMNKDKFEDQMTIKWRLKAFRESINMGFVFPFGVGLRNYYDWTEPKSKAKFLSMEHQLITEEASVDGPHNIIAQFLAETGYIGISVFVFMLVVFVKKDLEIIRSKDKLWLEKVTIISGFWGFIFVTIFYPATSLNFYISFFLFRAMLIA